MNSRSLLGCGMPISARTLHATTNQRDEENQAAPRVGVDPVDPSHQGRWVSDHV